MRPRIAAIVLALVPFLAIPFLGVARAGGETVAGNWKLTFLQEGEPFSFLLLSFESKDGTLTGSRQTTLAGFPTAKVANAAIDVDLFRFELKLSNGRDLKFEGKLPRAGGKKINGSITFAGSLHAASLEATHAKNPLELKQETITRMPSDPRFATLLELIPMAAKEKAPAREVLDLVDGVLKTAESYGPTFQSDFGVKVVDALKSAYPAAAIEAAAKVQKSMDPKGPPDARLQLLSTFASSLKKIGRAEEAAKLTAQLEEAEKSAFKQYVVKELDFKVVPSTAKATRPVLVELFTGAQCPPCVAADIAFDGLEATYNDEQAILLQYHLHIPGPDPLTGSENFDRVDFYGDNFKGPPMAFFNGRFAARGGGPADAAEEKYKQYVEYVDKLMPSPATAKVTASAVRKGDDIAIKTEVTDGEKAGKAKLHVVLSEDWVRYKGGNGVRYHRNVVRSMVGGADGFGVGAKGLTKELTVDLAKLRTDLAASLDAFAQKEEVRYPSNARPMRMQDLHVVAFVQSEESGEVVAAVRVPVK